MVTFLRTMEKEKFNIWIHREIKRLMSETSSKDEDYTYGEVLYSIFRLIPETVQFAKSVKDLDDEIIYKAVQSAIEEEVETEYFKS